MRLVTYLELIFSIKILLPDLKSVHVKLNEGFIVFVFESELWCIKYEQFVYMLRYTT